MDAKVMELRIKQWLPLLEAQANSGLSKQDWCDQNGIKRGMFFKWQKECRQYLLTRGSSDMIPPSEPAFVEVCCSKAPTEVISPTNFVTPGSASSITISRNGFSVLINGDVDVDNLSKVFRAMVNAD